MTYKGRAEVKSRKERGERPMWVGEAPVGVYWSITGLNLVVVLPDGTFAEVAASPEGGVGGRWLPPERPTREGKFWDYHVWPMCHM
jgi:hypothetical protein